MKQHLLLTIFACLLVGACGGSPLDPGRQGGAGGAGGEGGWGGAGGEPEACGPLASMLSPACGPDGCWEHPAPAPLDVHAGAVAGGGGLWLVGEGSAPLRWDGERWGIEAAGLAPLDGPMGQRLFARGEEAWLARGGRLHHWARGQWAEVDFGPFHPHPSAAWAFAESLWVAGTDVRRFDGTSWASLPVQGGPFYALWGQEDEHHQELWAVGAKGAIHRWRDGGWEVLASGTTSHLRAIWGSSPTDLWVGGDAGTLLRWDGEAFTRYPIPTRGAFTQLAGSGPWDVFALAYDAADGASALFRWNGSLWIPQRIPGGLSPLSVWRGEVGVWVGGAGGGLAHWNDGCWSLLSPAPAPFVDLHAGWAVGLDGWVGRSEGGLWKLEQVAPGHDLHSVWTWRGEVWIAGTRGLLLRGGAEGFRPFGSLGDVDLRVVRGHEAGDLWIGARDGSLHRFDGAALRRTPSPTPWPIRSLVVLEGAAWATTDVLPEVLRWDGVRWSRMRGAWGAPTLFGTSETDLWLRSGGSAGASLEHWDGGRWRLIPTGGTSTVRGIAGAGGGDGDGVRVAVAHTPQAISTWDGTTWTTRSVDVAPRAVAWADEVLWILGERHLVARPGTGPDQILAAPGRLHALWAQGGEVWVAGEAGLLATLQGGRLTSLPSPTDHSLHALGGTAGDLYAAGEGGALLHLDGDTWRSVELDEERELLAIASRGDAVWVVGTDGAVLERQGVAWAVHPSPAEDWVAAELTQDGTLWVAAREGGLYARSPMGEWTQVDPERAAHVLWGDEGGRLWIGGPPAEDGSHLIVWENEAWTRHELGVTRPLGAAAPLGRSLAVAEGAHVLTVDPTGTWRTLGVAPGPIRALDAGSRVGALLGVGRSGGIFRLHPQGRELIPEPSAL